MSEFDGEKELWSIDSHEGAAPSFDLTTYEIDFDKMKTVEDINEIFKAIGFQFVNSHSGFDQFKHLLKRVDK